MGWRQAKESSHARRDRETGTLVELISWCNRGRRTSPSSWLPPPPPPHPWKVNERLPAGTSEIVQEIQPRRNHGGPLSVVVGRRREKGGGDRPKSLNECNLVAPGPREKRGRASVSQTGLEIVEDS